LYHTAWCSVDSVGKGKGEIMSDSIKSTVAAMKKFAALASNERALTAMASLAQEITSKDCKLDEVVESFADVHYSIDGGLFAVVEDCKAGIVFMLGLTGVHRKTLKTVREQKAYDYRFSACWQELAEKIGLKEKPIAKAFDLQKLIDGFKAKIDAAIEANEIDELEALTALQLVIAEYLETTETTEETEETE